APDCPWWTMCPFDSQVTPHSMPLLSMKSSVRRSFPKPGAEVTFLISIPRGLIFATYTPSQPLHAGVFSATLMVAVEGDTSKILILRGCRARSWRLISLRTLWVIGALANALEATASMMKSNLVLRIQTLGARAVPPRQVLVPP